MRIVCSFLLLLFLCTTVLAEPKLIIDKLNRKDINTAPKEAAFSTLLEGTVSEPDRAVFVLVYEPQKNVWRSYRANVQGHESEPGSGYKWRAICHFGEFDGRGVGDSYQVRVIAQDRKLPSKVDGNEQLQSSALQTETIVIKRVEK